MPVKKKEVYYSYLLKGERALKRAIHGLDTFRDGDSQEFCCKLHKSKKAALKSRKDDTYDGEYKPGPIVKITLEIEEDA